jgi:hypothetical protein
MAGVDLFHGVAGRAGACRSGADAPAAIHVHSMPRRIYAALVLSLSVASCASTQYSNCNRGENRAVLDTLYFGTAKSQGVVAADEWTRFLEEIVTPRFPRGLTVLQGLGQWRGTGGSITRESTYILQLVHADDTSSEKSVAEIVAAYKTAYQQEAVLRVRTNACSSL